MLRFGVVGMNPGNGHPYSFSAVFNGFDPAALANECEFPLIREYLVKHHGNREFIGTARVTHVWAPEPDAARRIARVARIPQVADSLAELAEAVDAILFTRDDIWNHWAMAGELFKTGKPVYMDKTLAANEADLRKFIAAAGPDYPLLTASSFRFAPLVEKARAEIDRAQIKFVNGVSSCVWVRYAPHLLDALFEIFGFDVAAVQNSGTERGDIVTVTFRDGLQAVLEIFDGVGLPVGLTIHRAGQMPCPVPYTDETLESYFLSIAGMMRAFTNMVESGVRGVDWSRTLLLNRVVLAGIASRDAGNRVIRMDDFLSDLK